MAKIIPFKAGFIADNPAEKGRKMAKLNRQEDFPSRKKWEVELGKYCHVFQMLNFGHKLFCHIFIQGYKRMFKNKTNSHVASDMDNVIGHEKRCLIWNSYSQRVNYEDRKLFMATATSFIE